MPTSLVSGGVLLAFASFAAWISISNAARILFIPAHASKSHLLSMEPLIHKMASRGHRVEVIETDFEPKSGVLKSDVINHFYSLPQRDPAVSEARDRMIWSMTLRGVHFPLVYYGMENISRWWIDGFEDDIVTKFHHEPYDVVVYDGLFTQHGIGIGLYQKEHHKARLAQLTTCALLHHMYGLEALGGSSAARFSSFTPLPTHPFKHFDPASFVDRVPRVIFDFLEDLALRWIVAPFFLRTSVELSRRSSWIPLPELYSHLDASFQEEMNGFGFPKPIAHDILDYGAHCDAVDGEHRELKDDELKSFMEDESSKGTVYIAFGSFAPWKSAPKRVSSAFLGLAAKFPDYRFIISCKLKDLKMPNNTRILSWAPQKAILAHPTTRAFISHGGWKSIKEALCLDVPLVVMPIFAEQSHNAQIVGEAGFGEILNKYELDDETAETQLRKVLSNAAAYKRRAKKWRTIFTDRPGTGALDRAAWALERLGKNRRVGFPRQGRLISFVDHFFGVQIAIVLAGIWLLSTH